MEYPINPGLEEINDLFRRIFHQEASDSESKVFNSNINKLIAEASARQYIKELSPLAISELIKNALPESLDRLLSMLTNDKLRSALSLIPNGYACSIAERVYGVDQRQRFLSLIKQVSETTEDYDIPAFLRKADGEASFELGSSESDSGYNELDSLKAFHRFEDQEKFDDLKKKLDSVSRENQALINHISHVETNYQEKLKNLTNDFNKAIKNQELQHQNKIKELEQQYSELIQKRIDENLTKYVSSAVITLNNIEKKLNFSAGLWSLIASATALITLVVGIGLSLFGYFYGPPISSIKWPELLILSVKGIFIISALAAAASFAFSKSNAYTHEALIVSNRAHAIQFGKLYLEIYGNTVERAEMVKIFENWNISPATAFLKKSENSNNIDIGKSLEIIRKAKEIINFSEK